MGGRPGETRLVLGPGCSPRPCSATPPPSTATPDLWTSGPSSHSLGPPSAPGPRPAGRPSLTVQPLCWENCPCWVGVGSLPHSAFVSSPKGTLGPSSSWSCPQQGPSCLRAPKAASATFPPPAPCPKSLRKVRCDLTGRGEGPTFPCTPDLPLGPD